MNDFKHLLLPESYMNIKEKPVRNYTAKVRRE